MDKNFFDEYFGGDDFEEYDESEVTNKKKKSKAGKTVTKGFLTALAICLTAIGASVWTTVKNVNSYLNPQVTVSESKDTDSDTDNNASFIVDDTQVNADVSGVKKDSSEDYLNDKVLFTFEPINHAKIINQYSEVPVFNTTLNDYRAHTGIDYEADIDDKVRVMCSGVVSNIYYDEMYGNTVVVKHSDTVESYYCGLANTALVQKGEVIEAGTFVGTVYAVPCETADKAHVHVGVKEKGKWTDPHKFMKNSDKN